MALSIDYLRNRTRRTAPITTDMLHLYSPATGKDHYVLLQDLIAGGGYPDWVAGTTYAIDNTVTFGLKLWKSLQNANTGNIPSENAWWTEVSGSTVGYWALNGVSQLTGVATIRSAAPSQLVFDGTWVATANNQFHANLTATVTGRAGQAGDTVVGYQFTLSMTTGTNGQTLNAVVINPTFVGTGTFNAFVVQNGGTDLFKVRPAYTWTGTHILQSTTSPDIGIVGGGGIELAFYNNVVGSIVNTGTKLFGMNNTGNYTYVDQYWNQNGSNATSTASQKGSFAQHFKSSLWNGSSETKGWWSWISNASVASNLVQTLALYQSTGSSPTLSSPVWQLTSTGIQTLGATSFAALVTDVSQSGIVTIQMWGGGANRMSFTLNGNTGEHRIGGISSGQFVTLYSANSEVARFHNANGVSFTIANPGAINVVSANVSGTMAGTGATIGFAALGSVTMRATSADGLFQYNAQNTITTGATNQVIAGFRNLSTYTINHTGATVYGYYYAPTINGSQSPTHYAMVLASGNVLFGSDSASQGVLTDTSVAGVVTHRYYTSALNYFSIIANSNTGENRISGISGAQYITLYASGAESFRADTEARGGNLSSVSLTILQNGSNATSTATQVGSLSSHFKSSLWNGSAEVKGWFSWRVNASTSVNQLQTLTLYQSTGTSPAFTSDLLLIATDGFVTIKAKNPGTALTLSGGGLNVAAAPSFIVTAATIDNGTMSTNSNISYWSIRVTNATEVAYTGTSTGVHRSFTNNSKLNSSVATVAHIGFDHDPTVTSWSGTHIAYRAVTGVVLFGGTTVTASTLLDLQSSTLALRVPNVTNIASVVTPAKGHIAYDAATDLFNFYQGSAWVTLGGTAFAIQTCDVTLNQSQIQNLNSSPVTLVAAPGANKFIYIISPAICKYVFNSAAFATNLNIAIAHGSVTTSNVLGNVINQTSDQVGNFGSVQWSGGASAVINQAVKLTCTTGNPTGGGASSTLRIYFQYIIVTL